MPTRQPKSPTNKRTKLGLDLEASAKDILAHIKGEKTFPTRRVVLPDDVDVKQIRAKVGMTQADFARAFHIASQTRPPVLISPSSNATAPPSSKP